MQKKSNDFEKNLLRLEEISQKLSLEEISLEEASKLYEEGVALSTQCKKYIEEKEMIIENLKSIKAVCNNEFLIDGITSRRQTVLMQNSRLFATVRKRRSFPRKKREITQ